ncbi:MAG TPA: acyl carrier protein [Mycobacteriales bacterium]|nr:acyl carrier protein [Mycobacteriales bacterium]
MSIPTADEVLRMLQEAIAVVMEIDGATVTREMRLVDDLGADSLALVEIVEILEERLAPLAPPGFRIEDDDLDAIGTVGEAVDYAVARL